MKIAAFLIVTLLLSGCGHLSKSDYQRPLLSLPERWPAAEPSAAAGQQYNNWWERFEDPTLSRIITQVLTSNNDLAAAAIALQQARVAAGLTATNLSPNVELNGSASNDRHLRGASATSESYSSRLSLSYELDLWGKLARVREQSEWQAVASAEDYQATVLSTIGTTAQLYWSIALYNQQIRNRQQSLSISLQTAQQVASWFRAGKVGQLDVLLSQQTVIDHQNQLRTLQQQRADARNALALLLNRPAEQHTAETAFLRPGQRVPLQAKTPLRVIAHRPDIQAAESRLRAALAGYDASRLSFYPSLSLNAALSAGNQAFSQWFRDPIRTIGTSLALPFIQWNTTQLTVKQSALAIKQAAITFRTTAYKALAEVDNAMEKRLSAAEQQDRLQQSLLLGRQRLVLTESRYRAGAVDFKTLLDAQDDLLTLENTLAQTQYDYLYATLQLWLAQGGGKMQYRILNNDVE